MSTTSMRENEFDTSTLLNEINVDYSRTMNKIIFDANMLVPENKHIAETLTLPKSSKKNTIPPEKGVVAVTQYDLEERYKSFVFDTFLVQPEVVYVLERVQQQCNEIVDLRLFNT
jgi:dynein heavy chain